MFRGFKNSEYLEYTLSSKKDKEFSQYRKVSTTNLIQTMSSIFAATIASTLSNTLSSLITIEKTILKFLATLGITLGIIVLSYVLLYCIIFFIYKLINEKCISKLNNDDVRHLIEKFDNVACDSIIVAEKFLDDISKGTLTQEISDYSLYEVIYYIRKATLITKAIIFKYNECISEEQDTSKIEMFRVRNVVKILRIQINKINDPNFIVSDKTAKDAIESIDKNIKELEVKLNELSKK